MALMVALGHGNISIVSLGKVCMGKVLVIAVSLVVMAWNLSLDGWIVQFHVFLDVFLSVD